MKTAIELRKGDITKIKLDAIVNAANKSLLGGGGVDGAIHKAAGPELLRECVSLGGCNTGQAKITRGYNLPSRYVIHTVGPIYSGGYKDEDRLLLLCYKNSLDIAKQNKLRTIAFPSISTGAYGFPIEQAAPIALNTTILYLKENPGIFDKIIFVLFSDKDLKIYQDLKTKLQLELN